MRKDGRAAHRGGEHELLAAQHEQLRAHDPRGADPAERADDDDDLEQSAAEQRHHHDRQQEAWDDLEHLGDAHQNVVGAPAEEARRSCRPRVPITTAISALNTPTVKRNAAAIKHTGHDVAPEIVGAHRMGEQGGSKRLGAQRHRVGAGEQRGEQGRK